MQFSSVSLEVGRWLYQTCLWCKGLAKPHFSHWTHQTKFLGGALYCSAKIGQFAWQMAS